MTFFTVQKSADKRRTTITNEEMKLIPKIPDKMYVTSASERNRMWKITEYGCLKSTTNQNQSANCEHEFS